MSTTVTLLVLAAALFHALWNAFVKKGHDPLVSIAGIALACGSFSALLLPFVGWPEPHLWPWIFVAITIHTIYMITLSQAYRYGDFSMAYPVARGLAPAIVVIVSLVFLNENFQHSQLIAIAGILFGIFIFVFQKFSSLISDTKSLLYALMTACFIASYTLLDGFATRQAHNPFNYIAWMVFLQTFPIFAFMLFKKGKAGAVSLMNTPAQIIGGGFMAFAGYAIVLWAMTRAPIALVATLRETSIIIAALIGLFWMKEQGGWRRIVAAVIIFLSVVYLKVG
jgi:drug/metabolite transporter (DMT)-like permease